MWEFFSWRAMWEFIYRYTHLDFLINFLKKIIIYYVESVVKGFFLKKKLERVKGEQW